MEEDAPMSSKTPCRGSGKNWTVNNAGNPICPGCYRGLKTVAGTGKSVHNTKVVPRHDRPGPQDTKPSRAN
jgi:hypothetical protein